MSIILIYSEGMASSLQFKEAIKNHSQKFTAIIEVPVIPKSKNAHSKINYYLIRKLVRSAPSFVLLNFFSQVLYSRITKYRRVTLSDIANAHGIYYCYEEILSDRVLIWLKGLEPEWIINGSATILNTDILSIPTKGTLNFHGAPLPKYRGAGNHYWLLLNKERRAWVTLHYVVSALDAGDIIAEGAIVNIEPRMSAYQLWRSLLESVPIMLDKFICDNARGVQFVSKPQDTSNSKLRSFPTANDARSIHRLGHPTIQVKNLVDILRHALFAK